MLFRMKRRPTRSTLCPDTTRVRSFVYSSFDTGVDEGMVKTSGRASSSAGGELRKIQTGKVQDYAAILYATAMVLAGVLIVIV